MRILRYSLILCVLAVVLSSLAFNLASGKIPTAILLPDMEQIPLYPGARIIEAVDESVTWRRLTYEVDVRLETVEAFYGNELAQRGWMLVESSQYYPLEAYVWKDPKGSIPWHLRLDVSLERTETDGTNVVLVFGRYPPIADELPVYSDASYVEIAFAEGELKPWYRSPPKITTKTYVTHATLNEIEQYYNTVMIELGWIFFEPADKGGRGPVDAQTGSIHSEEGLYFVARKPGSTAQTTIGVELFITAHEEQNGQAKVQLKAIEVERKVTP